MPSIKQAKTDAALRDLDKRLTQVQSLIDFVLKTQVIYGQIDMTKKERGVCFHTVPPQQPAVESDEPDVDIVIPKDATGDGD